VECHDVLHEMKDQAEYRWYEVGFFTPLGQVQSEPRAVLEVEQADLAAFIIGGAPSIAYGRGRLTTKRRTLPRSLAWLLAKLVTANSAIQGTSLSQLASIDVNLYSHPPHEA